jgi:hypothetical protein
MEPTRVEVAYCEGWDAATHAAFRPLKEQTARDRHETGQRYAALLSIEAEPRALIQVDTGSGYVGVFSFDLAGRRSLKFSYKDLGDHLMLRELKAWRHVEDDEPEFSADLRITFRFWPDEPVRTTLDDTRRGQFTSYVKLPGPIHRIPSLEFGKWPVDGWLLGTFEPLEFVTAPDPETEATGPFWAPWSAPEGAQPTALEALFIPGTRIRNGQGDVFEVQAPASAGRLRLTTGRIVAADPATVELRGERATIPYTVALEPGEYSVETARLRFSGREWDVVAAARLRVSDAATETWELALRPGQDERLLGASEFYGFVVDSGTGAFMDASAVGALAAYQDAEDAEAAEATIPCEAATELRTFPSGRGDGSYPVWIGRDATGAVTCLVADMRLLGRGIEIEAPDAISTARHVPGLAELEPRDVEPVEAFSSQAILEFFNDTADAQAEFWARRMGR